MKVSNNVNPALHKIDSAKVDSSKGGKAEAKAESRSANASGALSGPAKLSVSERAQQMAKAKEIASDQSIDEAKVARLQKMIDEGSYKTDAAAIADRMVNEHLLMND
jgi:flagellar biosynthesis anti-sigma factor FlgM